MHLKRYTHTFCVLALMVASCTHHKKVTVKTKPSVKKTETASKNPDQKSKNKSEDERKENSSNKENKKDYAEKLGVEEKEIRNEKLYKFIDEWYSVPYKYGGKNKKGIDCSAFAGILCSTIYNKKLSPSSKAISEETKKISVNDLREGDLVFFIINGKSVSHVGVYLQHNKFVHATTKKGVIISDLNEPYYIKYFYSAGRIK